MFQNCSRFLPLFFEHLELSPIPCRLIYTCSHFFQKFQMFLLISNRISELSDIDRGILTPVWWRVVMDEPEIKFDEVGKWSEIKLEIIEKYAKEYSKILARQSNLTHVYIDGFAGLGEHLTKKERRLIKGSPAIALGIDPPFAEYHFIDLNAAKARRLRDIATGHINAFVYEGDCNEILLSEIFPTMTYQRFRGALCLLDPYGLQLNWDVILKAGQSKVIEIFLNFPVADMNRNVFWRNPEGVSENNINRMNRFWGDESWRNVAYSEQPGLFGPVVEKEDNYAIADGFRRRLLKVAGFNYVPEPLPMRNSQGAIVYYLFFASCKKVADTIVEHIFSKFRR